MLSILKQVHCKRYILCNDKMLVFLKHLYPLQSAAFLFSTLAQTTVSGIYLQGRREGGGTGGVLYPTPPAQRGPQNNEGL
jgi:hypothetical protein